MRRASRGTTFLELALVVSTLGIVSTILVPRYLERAQHLRSAAVRGFADSVRSAASFARGLSLATENAGSVALEGARVRLLNNYPDPTASGIAVAVRGENPAIPADFSFTPGRGTNIAAVWIRKDARIPAECAVSYTAAADGAMPQIAMVTIGC
jgi:hypothetical protein